MKKPRIGIVIGSLDQPKFVLGFESLLNEFEVCYFAIEVPTLLSSFRPSAKLFLFENVQDMPGYMRGLEEHVSGFDLLIGVETSRLATFQMVRLGQKLKIPSVVMVTEYHPFFYANYPNIRAIQMDVFASAKHFWPVSKLAMGMLKVEGVDSQRISQQTPMLNLPQMGYSATGRAKFRKYIGVSEDEVLMLYHGDLSLEYRLDHVLSMLRVLKVTDPQEGARVKLLIVGDGPNARELKYQCHDYRLGSSVIFMHQDAHPFLSDLYSASDIRFVLESNRKDIQGRFPFESLESSAAGVLPVYYLGSELSEYMEGHGVQLTDQDMNSYADAVGKLIRTPGLLAKRQNELRAFMLERFAPSQWADQLKQNVRDLLKATDLVDPAEVSKHHLDALKQRYLMGERLTLIEAIDTYIKVGNRDTQVLSELWQIKGEVLFDLTRLDDSMAAFEVAIQVDEQNHKAYRGLGFIAFKGHSHEEAISFFKKSLAKCENDAGSLFGIALVHRRLSLVEEAMFWLEKGIDVEGLSPRLSALLSQTSLESSHPQKAIEVIERVMDQKKPSVSLLMTLGQLYMKIGRTEMGCDLMAQAEAMESLVKRGA